MPPKVRARSRSLLAAVAGVGVLALGMSGSLVVAGGASASPSAPALSGHSLAGAKLPGLGLLGVDGSHFAAERAAGIHFVTIDVGWANAEPADGAFDTTYISRARSEISAARATGLGVVLDPGLQYAPNWVFQLPGGTQFVDQYGDVFTGPQASGNDVANAVTDMAVRSAEGNYLHWLGSELPGSEFTAVRVGGGPFGELRYPGGSYNGHHDCFWSYDTSSQASSPVRGWKPGTGSAAQAREFLQAYNENMVDFGDWLDKTVATAFPATDELVLLPGWGERPGVANEEAGSLMMLGYDEFNQGLDWTALLPSLPDPANAIAYTTYLDAPSYNSTPQGIDPADYIASLAAPLHLRTGGENTGDGTRTDLQLVVQRGLRLHMAIVNWMDEAQVITADNMTAAGQPQLTDLASAEHRFGMAQPTRATTTSGRRGRASRNP